jgi:hypothetical protein
MDKITPQPSNNEAELVKQYVDELSEKEKKAYNIAKSHLGMSFQVEKSNGFLKWKKNKVIPS